MMLQQHGIPVHAAPIKELPTPSPGAGFRRVLEDDQIVVTVEGRTTDPDPLGGVVSVVVIRMPDFLADSLAHVVERCCRLYDLMGGDSIMIGSDRAFAAALSEAAAWGRSTRMISDLAG